mgnify:FL=1|jgi:hypothetical protein|tara:strand:+ start:590 stop:1519 length:930 start_codon:yes stop_codon:yes gene_type:complete
MAINRGNISKELLPGLNAIFGLEYGSVDDENNTLFETENSDRAFEEEVLFTMFGEAPVKSEGAAVQYDSAQEAYTSRYTHETVALAFAVTEEAMEDNLYDTFAKVRAKGLARAMASTKQVKGANVFNNAFSASYVGGDAVALISASHPTIGDGNQSNKIGTSAIAVSTIETAVTAINKIKDDRGILVGASPTSVHIPPELAFETEMLLKSAGLPLGSVTYSSSLYAPNDLNPIKSLGILPGGSHVNRRFTDTDNWFVKTDCPNGTKMFNRSPLATKMEPDFDTGNLRFKARERYSFGWSDWRHWFGAEV